MKNHSNSVHPIRCLLLGVAVAVLAGCTSVPLEVNEGKIKARTFSFMALNEKANNAFVDNRAEVHGLIQEAITRNLAQKGVTKVERGGDLVVGYLIVVSSNLMTTAINDYFGYGAENEALVKKAHQGAQKLRDTGRGYRIRDPETYMAGALVVDIIDGRTLLLQYRNYAYRDVLRAGVPAEVRSERLQEVVDEVLLDLRVKPGRK